MWGKFVSTGRKYELHEVFLDRWPDFQSLQLTDEPPEEEEEDPFTAKLMSFEVQTVTIFYS